MWLQVWEKELTLEMAFKKSWGGAEALAPVPRPATVKSSWSAKREGTPWHLREAFVSHLHPADGLAEAREGKGDMGRQVSARVCQPVGTWWGRQSQRRRFGLLGLWGVRWEPRPTHFSLTQLVQFCTVQPLPGSQ